MADCTFTLPELALLVNIEYRTLHTWVGRGLLRASREQAQGSGTRNVFDRCDALEAYVLAELRRAGVELSKLERVAKALRDSRGQRADNDEVLLVNGAVWLSRREDLADAVSRASPTLVYDLAHARIGLEERFTQSLE